MIILCMFRRVDGYADVTYLRCRLFHTETMPHEVAKSKSGASSGEQGKT